MNCNDINNLEFNSLRRCFLSGDFEYDDDLAICACNNLHEKLVCIEDLLPLLESGYDSSVDAAVYIASEEGSRAKPIFRKLTRMLGSALPEVRYNIIDCFLECAESLEDISILVSCLEDDYDQNRVKAIQTLMWIRKEIYKDIVNKAEENNSLFRNLKALIKGNPISKRDCLKELNKTEKVFCYIMGVWSGLSSFEVSRLASDLSDWDIKRHSEIYFSES